MANKRAIVKRRKAIRNIRKITRTMELIATARYKKALDRAVQAEAFTRKIGELVADLSQSNAALAHPLLQERPETKRSVLLMLTANRGLCGGYNGNVTRLATRVLDGLAGKFPVELEVSGKRGIAFCRYRHLTMSKTYVKFEEKPTFAEVEELANNYLERFLAREIDRLDVVYTRFYSLSRQQAEVVRLLPMTTLAPESSKATGAHTSGAASTDYEFYPSADDIMRELVPTSFKIRLFKCFLDAAVSEQIARMVAMKGATENAGALIKELTSQYNRARQSQITSELAEIIGTAEALK